jgi:hypothetical protein
MTAVQVGSVVQVLVMPVVGALYYVVLARRRGRLGRYAFGYLRRRLPPTAVTPVRGAAIAGLRAAAADARRSCAGAFTSLFEACRALSRVDVSPSSRLFEELAARSG